METYINFDDGDQVTIKILWTQEANDEIQKALEHPSYYIKPTGDNIREIGKEGLQTFIYLRKYRPYSDIYGYRRYAYSQGCRCDKAAGEEERCQGKEGRRCPSWKTC